MDIMEDLYTTTFSNNESFFKKAAAEIESLRTQIAELTKTNLEQAAQIEMLLEVLQDCHSAMLGHDIQRGGDLFGMECREAEDALSTPPSQALADFAAKVRKQCAVICDGLQHQRNKYIEEDGADSAKSGFQN